MKPGMWHCISAAPLKETLGKADKLRMLCRITKSENFIRDSREGRVSRSPFAFLFYETAASKNVMVPLVASNLTDTPIGAVRERAD